MYLLSSFAWQFFYSKAFSSFSVIYSLFWSVFRETCISQMRSSSICLTSLASQMPSTSQHARFSIFLQLHSTPLCRCHIFFSFSSVVGHLGCFYILVMVLSAAMNIRNMYLFKMVLYFGDMC